jgi:membrane protein DedA with SNARE-associated domain
MVTEKIAEIAVQCLDKTGYWGAGFLMALESMIAPVPSEAVMPFVGFQVADGKWSLWAAVLVTSLGSIIGSSISYLLGAYGGRPLVLKVGKYLLLNEDDLHMTEKFFHKRAGTWTLFISRFIPVVRHLVSIPAGMGEMPVVPFLIATAAGATIWNSFLLFCGMRLKDNWTIVQKYSHKIDIVVVILVFCVFVWFVKTHIARAVRRK